MKFGVSAILVTALFSTSAEGGTGGFQGPRAIVGYDVGDTDVLYIKFSDPGACNSMALVPKGKPYYNDMLAMTISAYNSGKPLNVYLNGCPSDGRPAEIVRMVQGVVF